VTERREGTPSLDYDTAYFCAEHAPAGSNRMACMTCYGPVTHLHHNPDAHDALLEAAKGMLDRHGCARGCLFNAAHGNDHAEWCFALRAAITAAEEA